jgi:hypothetical protein
MERRPRFSEVIDSYDAQPAAVTVGPEAGSLDLLRAVYRDETLPLRVRMRAAEAALPFERPKLAAVLSASISGEDFGEALERARKRMDGPQAPLLKAPATQTDLSGPPMVSDRRFRK